VAKDAENKRVAAPVRISPINFVREAPGGVLSSFRVALIIISPF
jgi:hypothetical protein